MGTLRSSLFRDVGAGRALITYGDDLLLVDLHDLAKPTLQGQFHGVEPTYHLQIDQREAFVAAGPYGIHHFDID